MKWMTHFFLGQTRSTPRGFQLKILFVTFPSSYVPNLYTIYWSKLIRLILPQLFLGWCCTLYFLFRFLFTGRILYEIYFHLSLVDTTCMHVYCVYIYIYSMSFTHVPWQSSHGNGGGWARVRRRSCWRKQPWRPDARAPRRWGRSRHTVATHTTRPAKPPPLVLILSPALARMALLC